MAAYHLPQLPASPPQLASEAQHRLPELIPLSLCPAVLSASDVLSHPQLTLAPCFSPKIQLQRISP